MNVKDIEQIVQWRGAALMRARIVREKDLALTQTLAIAEQAIAQGERLLAAGRPSSPDLPCPAECPPSIP